MWVSKIFYEKNKIKQWLSKSDRSVAYQLGAYIMDHVATLRAANYTLNAGSLQKLPVKTVGWLIYRCLCLLML